MAKLTSPDQLQVSTWWTQLDSRNLHQIKDEAARIKFLSWWEYWENSGKPYLSVDVWPTRKEALFDLRTYEESDKEGLAAYDKMLAECE